MVVETVQSADGTTIAFERSGDGPPLILVLGAFCDRTAPRTLVDMLEDEFTVYAYDRRGRGASGDTLPYAVEREVEDLDALISEAGGAPFVFGHSSGAVLALEAAARQVSMSRLAIYEPPYIVDHTRTRPQKLGERVSALIDAGCSSEAIKLFLTEGPKVPPQAIDVMEASQGWPHMEAIVHTLPYDLAICGDQVVPRGRLASINVPTLALSGGASPEWARIAVDAVAAAIPGTQHASLEGQTHGVADDVIAPVLARFFLN